MRAIEARDWDISGLDPVIVDCHGNTVRVVELGIVGLDTHRGFGDAHSRLVFGAEGRSTVRGGGKSCIIFRYEISGWEYVESASLWIFRSGSNRPVGYEPIRAAKGQIETYGTVAGLRLTTADERLMPQGVLTMAGGPYMARLVIDAVKPHTRVATRALRTYFDVLPVVIIGAGAAGLAAAATLLAHNESVVVLEARDRVGGRAHTVTSDGGHAIDLGCQWFHDAPENPWLPLAPKGSYPHDQKRILVRGGTVLGPSIYDAIVEKGMKACKADESVMDAIRKILPAEAKKAVLEEQKADITRRVGLAIDAKVVTAMQGYDPSTDVAGARAVFLARVARDRGVLPAGRQARVNELVADVTWKTDNDVLGLIRASKTAAERRRIEAAEKDTLTDGIRDAVVVEQRAAIANRPSVWLADPLFLLAAGIEGELEESIEVTRFNSVERMADDGADDVEDVVDAEEADGFAMYEPPEADVPEHDVPDTNRMPRGGFGTTLIHFAESLQATYQGLLAIHTGRVVSDVRVNETDARVLDLGDHITAAAAVIVTVPTAVLSSGAIEFHPALPDLVNAAFAVLPLGHYKKIILQLTNGTAPVTTLDGFLRDKIAADAEQAEEEPDLVTDLSIFSIDADNVVWKFLFRAKERLIVAFVGGAPAKALDAAAKSVVRTAVVAALASTLNLTTHVIDAAVTEVITSSWSSDPFSLGAYSYTRPSGVGYRKFLRGVVVHNRIVFAGEALWYESYGTAHGAYLSGEVAAKLVRDRVVD
ncbi:MAG TPA: FAD-dependent oxidoreductase [Thermoanaerobaculia bacterium]|nr:FAD-dependent oxidoreductase [Thermoanaerobaculia bacterium]